VLQSHKPVRIGNRHDPQEKAAQQAGRDVARLPAPELDAGCAVPATGGGFALGGAPLPPPHRAYFERGLGSDLSQVRVHTDAAAGEAARAAGARAFALGHHIAFAPGAWRPETPAGRELIGHELAHTMQPGAAGTLRREPAPGAAGDEEALCRPDAEPAPPQEAVSRPQAPHPPGGAEGAQLLAQHPRLAAALSIEQWTRLANAAEARAATLGQPACAPGSGPVSFTLPLAALLDTASRFVDVEVWDAVFALFEAHDTSLAAGALIRNEIARRWFQRHAVNPAEETVELSLFDPEGEVPQSPTQLDLRWRGQPVFDDAGGLGIASLERASPGVMLATIAAEVRTQAQQLGEALVLRQQADDFDLRVPGFLYCAPQDFSKLPLGRIAGYLQAITQARSRLRAIAGQSPAAPFVAGLDARLAAHLAPLNDLYVKAHEWKDANPGDVTMTDEVTRKIVEKQGGWYTHEQKKMFASMFGEEHEQEISDLWHADKISLEDAQDYVTSYRRRKIVVDLVMAALAVATAGVGDLAFGGLAVTEEAAGLGLVSTELPMLEVGLEFRMAAGGAQAATMTAGTMAAEHLMTASTDFADPTVQALWRQGAHSFDDYARAGTLSFMTGAGTVVAVEGVARFFRAIRGLVRSSRATAAPAVPEALPAWGDPEPASTALTVAESAPSSSPAMTVLSDITDPVSNVRTLQLQSAEGELATVVMNVESGNGYLVRFKTGETLQITDGEIGGPLRLLDAGPALQGGAAGAPAAAVPAPLMLAPPAAGPLAVTGGASAGEAALRQELSTAFAGIGQTLGEADQQALAEALNLIDQLPPGPERDLVLGTQGIVGQGLGAVSGHVEVAMRLVAEAQREGLPLQQLLDRQRAAWQQIEPQLQAGQWQGLGVNSPDPRAVYSRAMLRLDQQAGRPVAVVPREASFGDRDFFESVASVHPTLYDMGIDLHHGWHGHALQDLVASQALLQAGAPVDSAAFRQVLGAIQTIGKATAQHPARQSMIGQMIWQAHYDSHTRPEFITAVLRRVLGYID
jgi:hypothetical protein